MQSSYLLKLSVREQKTLAQEPLELIAAAIHEHAEQIGYMLQAYFPREKVRKVRVVPGSVIFLDAVRVSLQLQFVKEEFNICSAIDTELKDQMNVLVSIDHAAATLTLSGENWPEL